MAVRDIRTGEFLPDHHAIGKKASAAVRLSNEGIQSIAMPEDAKPGERIHFASGLGDRRDVLTSPLRCVERPPREIVRQYAS